MTHFNRATAHMYRKYPLLVEMERLYPDGIPEQLKEGLEAKGRIWERLLAILNTTTEALTLKNPESETAIISPVSGQLKIFKNNGKVFEATYEDRVSALYEAFESGFLQTMNSL